MAVSIPRDFVEFVLLGPAHDRRQLQDSPILGDVWVGFSRNPDKRIELLLTPYEESPAGLVASILDDLLQSTPTSLDLPNDAPQIPKTMPVGDEGADIAPLHGIIAARLTFEELLTVVMPLTAWWRSKRISQQRDAFRDDETSPARINGVVTAILKTAQKWRTDSDEALAEELLPAFDRYIALAGLLLWASKRKPLVPVSSRKLADEALRTELEKVEANKLVDSVVSLLNRMSQADEGRPLVFQISLNRNATAALERSVPAVKADAARTLFSVNCQDIAWAVIDSGIQGNHPAFCDIAGNSRVVKSYDFSNIRKIVSLDNLKNSPEIPKRLEKLLHDGLVDKPDEARALTLLKQLADEARRRRSIDWELVRPFVEIKPNLQPTSDHGTHVAGVIGADKRAAAALPTVDQHDYVNGMCPDIRLFDFRVLAPSIKETEFAIIAALQYIRFLNARTDQTTLHGANLSLSIPHDVRNYACGRTPICLECERLVESGVVVVAAAGNFGYQSYTTTSGSYDGYTAFSVTDPGNAESVITVGATHRNAPHTYGVSFFSSRGPTGDGRAKPDLVAPGERIRAPFREGWGDLDGTSMAAPHVSGAAAMLLARYAELIGQPRRVKKVLCESATDLGRERSFQGHGMLDVLRAFQVI